MKRYGFGGSLWQRGTLTGRGLFRGPDERVTSEVMINLLYKKNTYNGQDRQDIYSYKNTVLEYVCSSARRRERAQFSVLCADCEIKRRETN